MEGQIPKFSLAQKFGISFNMAGSKVDSQQHLWHMAKTLEGQCPYSLLLHANSAPLQEKIAYAHLEVTLHVLLP